MGTLMASIRSELKCPWSGIGSYWLIRELHARVPRKHLISSKTKHFFVTAACEKQFAYSQY